MRSRYAVERRLPAILPLVALLGLVGCGGAESAATYEPTTDPEKLYMRLALNSRAINLSTAAPYSTFQLKATPLDGLGAPLDNLRAPTFLSSDTTVVWVTPEGLLQARGEGFGVQVIADIKADGNVRHADTAYVNVTTDPAPRQLDSLSIHPVAPDSAIWSMARYYTEDVMYPDIQHPNLQFPHPRALDATGDPIDGLVIDIFSLNPAMAEYDRIVNYVTIHGPGQVGIVAQTTAYGVTKADTVVFTITLPVAQRIAVITGPDGITRFEPSEVKLAPHGLVFWASGNPDGKTSVNGIDDSVDVTFEDPTSVAQAPTGVCDNYLWYELNGFPGYFDLASHCGMGNVMVPPVPAEKADLNHDWSAIVRQFPVPGIYRYHSTRTGATGQIIVTSNPD